MALRIGASLFAVLVVAAFPAAVCSQTVTETFDAGIPASWTIVDNHALTPGVPDFSAVPWTVNTAESMDNYTDGTPSLAATASSFNHPGQYDVSLITPPFELNAGADGRSIRYNLNFYRVDAFEFFDTNVSINGGPWITMVHETTTRGAPYSTGAPRVSVGVDLTFFGAAVGDTAQVEFRYYSTFLLPMVHNEYVEIDNVRTPTFVPEPGTAALALVAMALTARRRKRR
jgi:hypothetical protein